MWDAQLAGLSAGARVVRYDHRGHGASPVPAGPYALADLGADVLRLLDALGVERASFCGLSLGGMVGMWLAANAPARIDRLVVVCSSAHLPPAEGWLERARAVRAAQTIDAVADAVLARWLTRAFAADRPDELRRLRAMLVATLIARGIAGARFEQVAPAAHLANVEQADAVTRLVRDHVQGGPR
jgi:3-oxoadipate enol-lactonase